MRSKVTSGVLVVLGMCVLAAWADDDAVYAVDSPTLEALKTARVAAEDQVILGDLSSFLGGIVAGFVHSMLRDIIWHWNQWLPLVDEEYDGVTDGVFDFDTQGRPLPAG